MKAGQRKPIRIVASRLSFHHAFSTERKTSITSLQQQLSI
jgi:hypothetical protein